MSHSSNTELVVVGGGPAGYAAAIRAAQRDADVVLVEKDAIGGTCLNRGCIPSKAFVSVAERVEKVVHAEHLGLTADVDVDFPQLVDWKDEVVETLTGGVEYLCRTNGVDVVDGVARFADDDELRVETADGKRHIAFDHAIVASGSRPMTLPGFEFDGRNVLSSADALALESVPDSLLVVGAGYIGMELATVYEKLGSDVRVVEMLDGVLPAFPDHLGEPVRERAEELGVEFHFGEAAQSWTETGDGLEVVTEDESGEQSSYDASEVLVAIGREPVTDGLGLDNTDVTVDQDGFVETDEDGRTASSQIFAAGDVAGDPMLAHAATKEGVIAADVVAGHAPQSAPLHVPAVVFTDPEVARVGLSVAEAEQEGLDPVVGEFPLRANGRSLTTDNERGFVRLIADGDSEFVVGGEVVGPEASELIGEIGLAVEMGATVEDVAATVHVHPSLSEATMEAAEHVLGTAIHTENDA
ncbi:dihydrolipoyl dehydrogenase [Halobium palmae]|uniref:Dihydrolipoyl dehydrogenase n=1 Tax=Halobium palmae TaxID=1776492 RepID=A0ABD5RY46_9EURY